MIEMVRQRDARCCAQRLADLAPVSLAGGPKGFPLVAICMRYRRWRCNTPRWLAPPTTFCPEAKSHVHALIRRSKVHAKA